MLLINKDIWKKMIDHLQSGLPNEACGILGGKDSVITIAYPMENISETPKTKYEINYNKVFPIQRELRQKDISIIGIIHSHPETQAYPSKTDIALAYSEWFYVIVSFKDPLNPDAHAFRIIDGKIEEHPIVIE